MLKAGTQLRQQKLVKGAGEQRHWDQTGYWLQVFAVVKASVALRQSIRHFAAVVLEERGEAAGKSADALGLSWFNYDLAYLFEVILRPLPGECCPIWGSISLTHYNTKPACHDVVS